jgi:transcriptional regulator with XRE-family HTH domain
MSHWTTTLINELRREKGWTLFQLGIEADVPRQTIQNVELGEHVPSVETVDKLLMALGYELEAQPLEADGPPKRR